MKEEVFQITGFKIIASMEIISTSALIIDKKVISYEKVLSKQECKEILIKNR